MIITNLLVISGFIIITIIIGEILKMKTLTLVGLITMMILGILITSTGITAKTGITYYDDNSISVEFDDVPLSKNLIGPSIIILGLSGMILTISKITSNKEEKTYGKKAFKGY